MWDLHSFLHQKTQANPRLECRLLVVPRSLADGNSTLRPQIQWWRSFSVEDENKLGEDFQQDTWKPWVQSKNFRYNQPIQNFSLAQQMHSTCIAWQDRPERLLSADFQFVWGVCVVHSGLPSYIGNGWGCAAGQCHLQNAACPCLLRARLSFDRAYEFLLLGLCIAHDVESQPRFMKS